MTTSTERGEFMNKARGDYSVSLWGSNPDETDNDDCWTENDFATREEAVDAFHTIVRPGGASALSASCGPGGWEYVMLDGPDIHRVLPNPDVAACRRARRDRAQADHAWQRECAMEAGMLYGVDAYNEIMRY